jgi:opine dehydrogenase
VFSFQTCPYSCKTFSPGSTFIKRRKKNWIASVEGDVPGWARAELKRLFPQIVYSQVPATTSLGNIGAVFHPTAYMLNLETIKDRAARGETFSFYVEGITRNAEVGRVVGEVDQIRLRIAQAMGCSVFGLDESPREDEWATIMSRVADLDRPNPQNARDLRWMRAANLQPIHDSVVSAQHWLAYTYGVDRIPGESLASAIGRTPHFQEKSYPQQRYADEDIPTGLVPLESLAARLGIPHEPLTRVIDLYERVTGKEPRRTGRNLEIFDTDYLKRYLLGQLETGRSEHQQRAAS